MRNIILFILSCFGFISASTAQMSATFTTTKNTQCQGADCDYNGPSILINEMMMSPATFDGCLSGTSTAGTCKGEWIELYNPNICEPIDISCYYLASNVYLAVSVFPGIPPTVSEDSRETYIIPQGTIIPPGGFCVVRGENAPAVTPSPNMVEIVIPGTLTGTGICASGTQRFWFPNAGGWFGFYDRNGVPQDAVSWGNVGGTNITNSCIPAVSGCNNTITELTSYDNFPNDRKTAVFTGGAIPDSWGKSLRRMPDGGNWEVITTATASSYNGTPTLGNCNGTCATLGSSSCDGTATVNVTGGSGSYSYVWSDTQGQLTQTATGLCAGTYQVTVKDNNTNQTQVFSVTVDEHVPTVTFTWDETVCNEGQTVPITGFSPVATASQTGVLTGTGVSGTDFNVATSGNGSFPVTYKFTDENGCTNTATGNIVVNPMPTATISGIDPNYCLSDQTITPTLTPAGGTLSGPGVTNNTFNILAAGVGNHTLTYTVDQNGCTATATVNVVITGSTPPEFTIQDKICLHDDPIALSGTPTGGTFSVNNQIITSFDPAHFGVGTFTVAYTTSDPNDTQCLAQATDQITVIDAPAITTNTPTFFCYGANDYNVVMNPAGGQLSGTLLSGNTLQVSTADAGNYSFTYNYSTPEGCQSSYTHNFTVQGPQSVEFEASQDCFQNVSLTADPDTYKSYEWSDGSKIIGDDKSSTTQYIEEVGVHTFTVTAINAQGCKATYSDTFAVAQGVTSSNFLIPNVITPNNDGANDVITMPMMDMDCIEYKVLILNRWGNLVYTCDKDNPTFSGTTQGGKNLEAGVYFYRLVSKDFDCSKDPYKPRCYGFITIVR